METRQWTVSFSIPIDLKVIINHSKIFQIINKKKETKLSIQYQYEKFARSFFY